MNGVPMSPAAAALLRALIARAGVARDRIFLIEAKSTDWQSLVFTGERHRILLGIPAPDSGPVVERMCSGLEDAEFEIAGVIVADIQIDGVPVCRPDGSISVSIEALTVAEN
jgi:hypothetical protein